MENPVWATIAGLKEADLRTKVIVPILERTSGLTQITDVHGTTEQGLDVVFFAADGIRRSCYGMQIKRGDISGGGSRDRTVSQIIDQLNLASKIKHPVSIHPSGEYRIERFIVATNGRISATARSEIARRFDLVKVDFWDLSEIVRRATEVFPELLQTADPEVIAYLRYLIARFETLDALDQVTGVTRRNLSDVFVEPALRRRFDPTLADSTAKPARRHSHSVEALRLPEESHNAVIIGEQNEGKTAILRMVGIRRADALLRGEGELSDEWQIPVLVRAPDINAAGSLTAAVAAALDRGGAMSHAQGVRETGKLANYLVMVDGFSEIPTEEAKDTCCNLIEAGVKAAGCLTLIAARPDDFLQPGYFNKMHHYTIQDFSQKQTRELIRLWTKDTVELADVAEKMVTRIRDALQLPGSPIPAIIGVMLYEKEHKYITNTAEAVDRYMVIRLGRYAQEMGVRMEVEWRRKEDMLGEVAFHMVTNDLDSIDLTEVGDIMDASYVRIGENPRSAVAVEELITAGVLDRTGERVSFYRTAFRDFFAAKHILNGHAEFDEFFEKNLYDRRWGQALVFAAGLRRHNSQLLLTLNGLVEAERDQLTVSDPEDYLYGAYLLGRILSNSEAADLRPRSAVLRTAVRAASDSADMLSEEAVKQFGNIGEVVSLVGVEHTLVVTVGVPWLAKQFKDLAADEDLPDDQRYLLASVYAHLACEDWIDVLLDAIKSAKNPRVIAALIVLVHLLGGERKFDRASSAKWKTVKLELDRKRRRASQSIDALLQVRDPVIELEAQRMRRLENRRKH